MRLLVPGLVAATLVAALCQPALAAPFECRPAAMIQTTAAQAKVAPPAQGRELTILAIGSSSTEGIGASAKDKTYPARLKAYLEQAWPKAGISIVNAGIGGETAPETLLRLEKLLGEQRFDLVIWQVGTNDAVTGGNLDSFKGLLDRGIAIARRAGTQIVLLDQQFYPGIKDLPRYRGYVAAVAETGSLRQVPVLSRFKVMSDWYSRDGAAFSAVLSGDGFHMSDIGYECLARDMASSLTGLSGTAQLSGTTQLSGKAQPVIAQAAPRIHAIASASPSSP